MQNEFSESGTSPPTQFYAYLYLREDGTPWYAGKGCNGRAWLSCKGHRPPKSRDLIIIQDFESEEDAFFAEKFLISFYGRIDLGTGCLRNVTDGGEGTAGAILSPEHRTKLGEAQIGHKVSPETKMKMSVAKLGKTKSVETRVKMSKAQNSRTLSPKALANIRKAALGNKHTLGYIHTPDAIAKMSTAACNRSLEHQTKLNSAHTGKSWSLKQKKAQHIRWHVNRNLVNPECTLCAPQILEYAERAAAAKIARVAR